MADSLILTPIHGIPLIKPGDNLGEILWQALLDNGIVLRSGDIIVLAQKIISKAEGRLVNLSDIEPSPQAHELAKATQKDARFVELVLRESRKVLRYRPGTLIVEHRLGFVCANAGIDHSNVKGPYGQPEDWVLLLPVDPDASAERLRKDLEARSRARLGVMIIDSHGRAWRLGTVGVCIGVSGVPALVDMRGQTDLFGYRLRVTQVAVADELAAAASLMMGQADERRPAVHVRGFPYPLRPSRFSELRRPEDEDLFR